jgi:hypothetical protein
MMKQGTVVIQSIRTTGGIADGYDGAIVITIKKPFAISVASGIPISIPWGGMVSGSGG